MPLEHFFENALYLLAILNPASKVMFLATYDPKLTKQQNFELSWKSSLAAFVILAFLAFAGQIVLTRIFRVELYSLQIVGGAVLFFMGWNAMREGRFVQKKEDEMRKNLSEISLVPLAAPLIAGPGMMAAAIAGCAKDGFGFTVVALAVAILINFILMLFAGKINAFLIATHSLGPMIRVTGLVISGVAVQMIIGGIKAAFDIK